MFKKFITISVSAATVISMGGCALKNNVNSAKIDIESQNTNQGMYKPTENKEQFVGFPVANESLKSLLRKLSDYNGVSYIYTGDDIKLQDSVNTKITSIKDLDEYIKTTTEFKLTIKNQNKKTSNVRMIELENKESNPFMKPFNVSVDGAVTLSKIFKTIADETGYSLVVDNDIDTIYTTELTNFSYSGRTLNDFITYTEKAKNIFIKVDHENKTISLSKYSVLFYDLPIAVPNIDVSSSIVSTQDGGSSSGSSSGSSTSSSSGGGSDGSSGNSNKISSSTNFKLDVYQDLENYLAMILTKVDTSKDIKDDKSKINTFYIQRGINKLIVRTDFATASVVNEAVADFIDSMRQQVDVTLTVYTVKLNNAHKYGINWNFIQQNIETGISAGFKAGYTPPMTVANDAPSILSFSKDFGNGVGMSTVLNNVNNFGKIEDVQSFSVSTINNVPVTQSITNNVSYLKSLTRTVSTFNAGNNDVIYTTETGNVNSGIFLYIHPKILKKTDEIMLNLSPTFTTLNSLNKITYGTSGDYIQVPDKSSKVFNNNIIVKDKEKIIITGIILDTKNSTYEGMDPTANNTLGAINALTGDNGSTSDRYEVFIVVSANMKKY